MLANSVKQILIELMLEILRKLTICWCLLDCTVHVQIHGAAIARSGRSVRPSDQHHSQRNCTKNTHEYVQVADLALTLKCKSV